MGVTPAVCCGWIGKHQGFEMRLLRFFAGDGRVHLGLRQGEDVLDATVAARQLWNEEWITPLPVIAAGQNGLDRLSQLAADVAGDARLRHEAMRPYSGLRLDAPLRDSPKLLALAGNYRKHVTESGYAEVGDRAVITPQVFCKPVSTAINAPGAPIRLHPENVFVDWEIELAVIIGRRGRNVPSNQAMAYIFGYSILNDISERKFNSRIPNRNIRETDPFFDWLMGKWFDGFTPFGPEIVTADEIADPHNLSIRLWVNDQLMQDANTSEMIFRIPEVVSYISGVMTIEPGDILSMGTPAGVGMARGVSLAPGDVMRGEIEGLGTLENSVVVD